MKAKRKKDRALGCVIIIAFASLACGCVENKFPVSPTPEPFEMIPPSDVGLLSATSGDARVTLHWGAPPERNIAAIYVTNANTGAEKKLPGDAVETEFTGLTNFAAHEFVVKTENDKGLLSYGAKVTAIPFSVDNIAPAPVVNLMGFKLTATSALATWNNPSDVDLAQIKITMGNETVVVARENTYAIINGDASKGLKVEAIDFSGNSSEVVEAKVDKDMVKITGTDDGTDETLYMQLDPAVVIIDQYRVTYSGDKTVTASAADGFCKIPMADLQATDVWKAPVKVGLISAGQLVTEYDYYFYNNIAGTIRAAFFDSKDNTVNIEGDMRNIGSLGNGSATYYSIQVKEAGMYGVTAYQARPDGSSTYKIYCDDKLLGEGSVGATGGWGAPYNPFVGPDDLEFPEGNHTLKIVFGGSGNYEKFLFTKK